MRVLLGFNGSEASRAAIAELAFIGLPAGSDVRILAVAEPWVAPRTKAAAKELSELGVAQVSSMLSDVRCSGVAAEGSPSREILAAAETYMPDLIILGTHGSEVTHGGYLGGTARTVMNEARCSVRVARREDDDSASRAPKLLVAYDGSHGSVLAVESIVNRTWPKGTEVSLLAVADASVMNTIGRFSPQMLDVEVENRLARQWAETLAATCLAKLAKADLRARVEMRIGTPKTTIVDQAQRLRSECIFVAPHCELDSYERYLLGSISAWVADHATCSVEVIR